MEVILSIIYHFQSYVYMAGHTSAYLNHKFSRVSHSSLLQEISSSKFRISTYICEYYWVLSGSIIQVYYDSHVILVIAVVFQFHVALLTV